MYTFIKYFWIQKNACLFDRRCCFSASFFVCGLYLSPLPLPLPFFLYFSVSLSHTYILVTLLPHLPSLPPHPSFPQKIIIPLFPPSLKKAKKKKSATYRPRVPFSVFVYRPQDIAPHQSGRRIATESRPPERLVFTHILARVLRVGGAVEAFRIFFLLFFVVFTLLLFFFFLDFMFFLIIIISIFLGFMYFLIIIISIFLVFI